MINTDSVSLTQVLEIAFHNGNFTKVNLRRADDGSISAVGNIPQRCEVSRVSDEVSMEVARDANAIITDLFNMSGLSELSIKFNFGLSFVLTLPNSYDALLAMQYRIVNTRYLQPQILGMMGAEYYNQGFGLVPSIVRYLEECGIIHDS